MLILQVRKHVETQAGRKFLEYIAIEYISQVVAGTNYTIKVRLWRSKVQCQTVFGISIFMARNHSTTALVSSQCTFTHMCTHTYTYTMSQKKFPPLNSCVTLSNLNRFSKFLHCWKVYENCYKTYTTLPTSPSMLLQYPGKLKIQILFRY